MRAWPAVAILLALATVPPAEAAPAKRRLEGTVLDLQGRPLAGVPVVLEHTQRGDSLRLLTDAKGRWQGGHVAPGVWRVRVETPGYAPHTLSFEVASSGGVPVPLEIRLSLDRPAGPDAGLVATLRRADEAFAARRFGEARAAYQQALALQAGPGLTLHQQIARCYAAEGEHSKQLEHLERALAADPGDLALKSLTAQEAFKAGLGERGEALMAEIDAALVDDPALFFDVAAFFINQGRPEKALPYLTQALLVDPNHLDARFQRALAHLNLHRLAEARADFQKFLEHAPEGAQAETARKALETLE